MHVDFQSLPDDARIWVYMSNRKLSDDELSFMERQLVTLTDQWTAHGTPVLSSYQILNDQFIVLAADERNSNVSGCSIDSSVNRLKQIQGEIKIDFFNRDLVPFFQTDGVRLLERKTLRKSLEGGIWNGRSLTFNLLANTVGQLRASWVIPANESWLATYIK